MKSSNFKFVKMNCTFILMASLLLCGCSRFSPSGPLTANGFYFDTSVSISIYDAPSQEDGERILSECMSLAEYYENIFSKTVSTSDISQINSHTGEYVTVHEETIELLQAACSYAELSDGLVDPTIGAVSSLWDFHEQEHPDIPSETALQKAISTVNYKNIHINGQQVMLSDSEASLDLGFIAKGFIADKMKTYLETQQIHSALIRLGGNILAIGQKPGGSDFRIGIQKPFAQTGTPLLTIGVHDLSVVSSGNYERYFIKDNLLYHHILSTETGLPVNSGLSQVTIISDRSVDGDAFSTYCFILGYENAATLLQQYPDIQAIFVFDDGTVSYVNFDSSLLLNAPE